MENEQLVRAKRWKKVANVAFALLCVILAGGSLLYFLGDTGFFRSPFVYNFGCLLGGTSLLIAYCCRGLADALWSDVISASAYRHRKKWLRTFFGWGGGMMVVGLVIFVAVCDRRPIFARDNMMEWTQLPGLLYFLGSTLVCPPAWELFFLKRLGKVGEP